MLSYQRFIQVACAAGWLVLACGGATREAAEQATAGAASGADPSGADPSGRAGASTMTNTGAAAATLAGRGGSASSGGSATAGAPLVNEPTPACFTLDELPEAWYADNTAGASSRECPVAATTSFGISYCYFELSDPVPASSPRGHEADCCYWLSRLHCR